MQPILKPNSASGDSSNGVQYNMLFIWVISLVAALGGLLFGYDFVVIGGAKPFFEKFYLITIENENASGWANSCALVGCMIGAILSGGLSDRYGRKRLLILSAFLFAVTSIGTGAADTFLMFVVWRMLGGVAIGLASNLSPMYIAEVAPAAVRGKLVAINQLTIVIGILAAQIVNWQIAEKVPEKAKTTTAVMAKVEKLQKLADKLEKEKADPEALKLLSADIKMIAEKGKALQEKFPDLDLDKEDNVKQLEKEYMEKDKQLKAEGKSEADLPKNPIKELKALAAKAEWWEIYDSWNGKKGWRWMFGLTAIPSVFFFLFMFFVPESPRWLAKNGKSEQAKGILGRIGGSVYADRAICEIEATLVNEVEKVNFRDLLDPKMTKVLILGVVLAIFQQWCGLNVIFNYADIIFSAAGKEVSDIMFNIVITGSVNMIFTFVAIFTVDRFGRRGLMLLGSAALAILHLLIGACFYLDGQGIHILGFVVPLIVTFCACFAFSLGPVVWVIISEIYPNRIRGAAVSVSVFALWLGCFTLVYTFPLLNNALGAAGTFWIYSVICFAGFFYVMRALPETKGKTLEQIEKELVD